MKEKRNKQYFNQNWIQTYKDENKKLRIDYENSFIKRVRNYSQKEYESIEDRMDQAI